MHRISVSPGSRRGYGASSQMGSGPSASPVSVGCSSALRLTADSSSGDDTNGTLAASSTNAPKPFRLASRLVTFVAPSPMILLFVTCGDKPFHLGFLNHGSPAYLGALHSPLA